ncbi:MAG TPA: hypothetical protein VHN77_06715 [Phycisphaerales bacterium]|nr:hypothetical protein [Phycisphaerales bacterium]
MRPHPRIRKAIKWGGAAFVVAIVVIYTYTADKVWIWSKVSATHITLVAVRGGRIEVRRFPNLGSPSLPARPAELVSGTGPTRAITWGIGEWNFGSGFTSTIPFWTPALAALMASALAWRLDTLATRRAKLNACKSCGYPRTGLAPSSPCPECGSAAPST